MKIVYCGRKPTQGEYDPTIDKIKSFGHEAIFYDFSANENEKNRWLLRHFQMYENVLNYVEEIGADLLYFNDPISCPELMISELKVRPNLKTKITSIQQFREVGRSEARANAIKELLEMPQIAKIFIISPIADNVKFPEKFERTNPDKSKIQIFSEPLNEDLEIFKKLDKEKCRKDYLFKKDDFVVLYSGSWTYVKGVDIFIEALKYIDKDIKVFIHKNEEGNSDPTLKNTKLLEEARNNHPNIFIYQGRIKSGEMAQIYMAADLVVCPHRKMYEYSTSGMPNMAAMAKIPIVAPDFYFFSEIVNRYSLGLTFKPEDPIDLARAINESRKNYDSIIKNCKFEESIKHYGSANDMVEKILRSIGYIK